VAPRMCRKEASAAAATARAQGRRPKSFVAEVSAAVAPDVEPRRSAAAAAAVTPRKRRDDVELDETTRAGPGRSRARAGGVRVLWAGSVGSDDAAAAVGKAKASAAAVVVTVKVVLKRKDAEALVARLNAQGARERKARMEELKGELRAEDCVGGGASTSPCRDPWKPRLAPIKENY
jgi:hypothetical protein